MLSNNFTRRLQSSQISSKWFGAQKYITLKKIYINKIKFLTSDGL